MEVEFNDMRIAIANRFNGLVSSLNRSQCLQECNAVVQLDAQLARQLVSDLRGPLLQLMCLENEEAGINSVAGYKLARMIAEPVNAVA